MKVGGSRIAWMGILIFWAFAAPLSAEKPLRRGDLRLGYAPLYSKLTGSNFSLGFSAQGGYRWLPWLETHAHVGIAFADNASADLSSRKFQLAIPFGLTANVHPSLFFLKN